MRRWRSGVDTDSGRLGDGSDELDDTHNTTANGAYAYNHDWKREIQQKAGPFGAAALQWLGDRSRKERGPPQR